MRSLDEIALSYNLDKHIKSGWHDYIPTYTSLFEPIRHSSRTILEIGIGSTENNQMQHVLSKGYRTGNSLKCWKEYFVDAEKIIGIDLFKHDELNDDKIITFVADQSSREQLEQVMERINTPLDVVIDDGSHIGSHQAASFMILCDYMAPGGIYVIEDIQPHNIDSFHTFSIFPETFRQRISQEFDVKSHDSRNTGRCDDFILSFTRRV